MVKHFDNTKRNPVKSYLLSPPVLQYPPTPHPPLDMPSSAATVISFSFGFPEIQVVVSRETIYMTPSLYKTQC